MLNDEQLALRRTGIGASEAAACLGLNKYRSPLDVWLDKTGRSEPDVDKFGPGTPAYWGNLIEQAIADTYAAKHNVKLRKSTTLVHKEHPFILATPDREVVGRQMLLECKASSPWRRDWGDEGTDDVPIEYIVQCHQQMAVRGWTDNGCDLALFQSITSYREYHIDFDQDFWNKCLERLIRFWKLVEDDMQPDVKTLADHNVRYPVDMGGTLLADFDLVVLHRSVAEAKKEFAEVKQTKDELEEELKIAMAGNSSLVDEQNTVLATYRSGKETDKLDRKSALDELKALGIVEVDEVIERHTERKPSPRRLVVKAIRE